MSFWFPFANQPTANSEWFFGGNITFSLIVLMIATSSEKNSYKGNINRLTTDTVVCHSIKRIMMISRLGYQELVRTISSLQRFPGG